MVGRKTETYLVRLVDKFGRNLFRLGSNHMLDESLSDLEVTLFAHDVKNIFSEFVQHCVFCSISQEESQCGDVSIASGDVKSCFSILKNFKLIN